MASVGLDAGAILAASLKSSFPSKSLHQMAQFADSPQKDRIFHRDNLPRLALLCGASPWAVQRAGDLMAEVFDAPPAHEIFQKVSDCASPKEAAEKCGFSATTIRDWHALLMARAALFDLCDEGDPWLVLEGYSAASELPIRFAYEEAWRETVRQHGRPLAADGSKRDFCVLGMGKLGGRELNASSDVDLIYLYEMDEDESAGSFSLREWFIEMAQRLTALLGPEGVGLRVDLRLRPGGGAAAAACSLESAEYHYEYFGQAWERQMLIRTRTVAGSERLGENFIETMRPFVFRRGMDPKALAEIRRIKSKLDAENGIAVGGNENVKLSRGGIRELEYVVQTYQLLYGGQIPQLRTPSMKAALDELRRRELLPEKDLDTCGEAYIFLRRLENRIQLFDGRQNHRLPPEGLVREALARSMGFTCVTELMLMYEGYRGKVTAIFDELFSTAEQGNEDDGYASDAGSSMGRIHLVPSLATLSIRQIAATGVSAPEEAYKIFARIATSPDALPIKGFTARLESLIPRIAALAEGTAEPLAALRAFERFVTGHKAAGTLLSMLDSDDRMAQVLMRLLGRGSWLAEKLLAHPEAFVPLCTAQDVSDGVEAVSQAVMDSYQGESGDKALRVLRRQKTIFDLQIALEESYREDRPEQAWSLAGGLAAGCVRAVAEIVMDDFEDGFDEPGICLMGSAGEGEPVMNSDLDLVFLCADPKNQSLATTVGRRIVRILESKSADGLLYRVDLRLRPFGEQGILVPSLTSAANFYRTQAPVTTRLALLHCRAICHKAATDFVEMLEDVLYKPGLTEAEIRDLADIRKRVHRQVPTGELDVKSSPGTLTDIEFFVGALQLQHAGRIQELRVHQRREAIAALARSEIITDHSAQILDEALRWFKRLENRLRTIFPRPLSQLPRSGREPDMLAKMMGYRDAGKMTEAFSRYQKKVLAIVDN